MPLELADLAKAPPALAFSKIRNVGRLPEPQALEFFNGLFHRAVEAKESGNWGQVEAFLQSWEDRLTSRSAPDALRFDTAPWAPLRRPLRDVKVALISTGGVYIKEEQEPYNTDGDVSYRIIPVGTPQKRLGIAHTHYDTSSALKDINVIFPYARMQELAQEGTIGQFADPCYGFMGYIPRPLVPSLLEQSAPEVARQLVAAGVEAALIGTT